MNRQLFLLNPFPGLKRLGQTRSRWNELHIKFMNLLTYGKHPLGWIHNSTMNICNLLSLNLCDEYARHGERIGCLFFADFYKRLDPQDTCNISSFYLFLRV